MIIVFTYRSLPWYYIVLMDFWQYKYILADVTAWQLKSVKQIYNPELSYVIFISSFIDNTSR